MWKSITPRDEASIREYYWMTLWETIWQIRTTDW
jgi:hypothetical protein